MRWVLLEVFLVPHFHYDLEWVRTKEEFAKIALKNIELVLKIMRKDPEFKFVLDQGILIELFRERRPSLWQEFLSRTREGRIDIVCGMYVMPDTLLPGMESLILNLSIGKRFLESVAGKQIKTVWMIDVFGHNFQIPQVMKRAGIEHYVMMRGYRGEPKMDFLWEGLDGSKVHVHHMLLGYHTPALPEDPDEGAKIVAEMIEKAKKYATQGKLMIPIGADFRRPNPTLTQIAKRASEITGHEVKVATPSEYMEAIDVERLPIVKDRLEYGKYFRVLPGCYSSRIPVKRRYRKLEREIIATEAFEAFCQSFGRRSVDFTEAWKTFLQNSFHDVICGCGIDKIYQNAEKRNQEVEEFLRREKEDCMLFLADKVDRDVEGVPILLFNPLPYERRVPIELEVDMSSYECEDVMVLDPEGEEIPSEITGREDGTFKLLILADLPPLGYEVIEILPREKKREMKRLGNEISSDNVKLEFLPEEGDFKVFLGGQLMVEGGNDLEVVTDSGDLYYSEEPPGGYKGKISRFLTEKPYEREVNEIRYEIREVSSWKSDVREAIKYKVVAKWGSDVLFWISYEISAFKGLPYVKFSGEMSFHYPHTLLRVCFPMTFDGEPYYEIPGGAVKGEVPECKGWLERHPGTFAVQDWISYQGEDRGVSLINDGLPEHKVEGRELKLTLLRSVDLVSWGNAGPKLYTPGALCIGRHSFNYYLLPYLGTWEENMIPSISSSALFPVFWKEWERGKGKLGRSGSLLRLDKRTKFLACRPHKGGIMLRFFEPFGRSHEISLEVSLPNIGISEADLLGNVVREFQRKLSPFEIKTLILRGRR